MPGNVHLVVCVNERLGYGQKSCAGSGSRGLIAEIRSRLARQNVDIPVTEQVCLGRCMEGIAMRIAPGGPYFTEVTAADLDRIIDELRQFTPAG